MGVRSLWKILKPSAEKVTPSGVKLAVDTSIWICQYGHLRSDDIVYFFSKRIVKLLYHRIHPIFVFDGKAPEMKRHAILQRRRRGNRTSINKIDKNLRRLDASEKPHGEQGSVTFGDGRYNWGDFFESDEDSYLSEATSSDEDVPSDGPEDQQDSLGSRISFDFVESKDLSRTQKLRRLVDLRGRRKEIRTRCSSNDPDVFSRLQIKNLRMRNLISHNIKSLEKGGYRRVLGDCRASYRLTKASDEADSNPNVMSKPENKESFLTLESDADLDTPKERDGIYTRNSLCSEHLESYPILRGLVDKYRSLDEVSAEGDEPTEAARDVESKDVTPVTSPKEKMMGGFFILDEDSGYSDEASIEYEERGSDSLYRSRKISSDVGQESREISRVLGLVKSVLEVFNIPYVDAPMEADGQCGFMCHNNVVDGVITEDNDVLLYGGTVYRNFFRKDREIEKYSLDRIERELQLDRKNLITLSYLLGSDYTDGVKGIGPVKALEAIRKGSVGEEETSMLLELYLNPVAVDVMDIPEPVVNKDSIREFYEKNGLSRWRMDGILFFLERMRLG
ncbi:DNA repair flap endonuclease [Encephalitozoon cuniculi EcunIII-L]|uniref:DNA repair protein rad2 n=1 Tax=Encephalitozoon cuniculi TaxID=6035 RepID=M1KAD8_ENCCN|nr:DNA repair protein rad2 [Encephalitozoon cuniculi]KMV65342.1 DNA repair flap endonuclease [Encephalitozoon cuniculi EcunIII-L]